MVQSNTLIRIDRQESPKGDAWKDLLQLSDGETVEVVVLRYRTEQPEIGPDHRDRYSVCISTQVGCACGCRFCATGQMGFVRQLSSEEIIAQVIHVQHELSGRGQQLSNVVLMGMGEPLLNETEVFPSLERLLDPRGLAFAPRRVTLSTVGIAPGIRHLADAGFKVKLAVSLHAATDALRNTLMPISAVRYYVGRTGRRILFEWVMIDGVNDGIEQAEALAARLADLPAHVNLIQLNPTAAFQGQPATPAAVDAFVALLEQHRIPHTMRQRRGAGIAAGCGQLRSRMTTEAGPLS